MCTREAYSVLSSEMPQCLNHPRDTGGNLYSMTPRQAYAHTCVDTRLCTCTCLAGDMVSVVDREHPRSHKVHNAEPNIQDQGREGLAEVRDLKETEESS